MKLKNLFIYFLFSIFFFLLLTTCRKAKTDEMKYEWIVGEWEHKNWIQQYKLVFHQDKTYQALIWDNGLNDYRSDIDTSENPRYYIQDGYLYMLELPISAPNNPTVRQIIFLRKNKMKLKYPTSDSNEKWNKIK